MSELDETQTNIQKVSCETQQEVDDFWEKPLKEEKWSSAAG
jgi:predicted 3-demethylubiquinone-9 3-methyltransferase (glyoxalase superfamily)